MDSFTSDGSAEPESKCCDEETDSRKNASVFSCAICQDSCRDAVVSKCGHVFCWQCIEQWLRIKDTCPTCLGHIANIDTDLTPIYGQSESQRSHSFQRRHSQHSAASGHSHASSNDTHSGSRRRRPSARRTEAPPRRRGFGFFNNWDAQFQMHSPIFSMFQSMFSDGVAGRRRQQSFNGPSIGRLFNPVTAEDKNNTFTVLTVSLLVLLLFALLFGIL